MTRPRNRSKTSFLYLRAKSAIQELIRRRGLREGDLLDSITKLAKRLSMGIKPVRTAIEQLIQAGILEASRGRGVFVKDLRRMVGLERYRPARKPGTEIGTADVAPMTLQVHNRVLHFGLLETSSPYGEWWREIVNAYNRRAVHVEVEIVPLNARLAAYTRELCQGERAFPDLAQIHSTYLRAFVRSNRLCNLADEWKPRMRKLFYPSVLAEGVTKDGVWGLPLTASVSALLLNNALARALGVGIPERWDSFDHYVNFIASVAENHFDRKGMKSVVFTDHGVFCYLFLGGLSGNGCFDTLFNFKRPGVRAFLERFGRVYRREVCYRHAWFEGSGAASFEQNPATLFYESNSYSQPYRAKKLGVRLRILPSPRQPNGHTECTVNWICISRTARYMEEARDFLAYLASDEVLTSLAKRGHLIPRNDLEEYGNPLLLDGLRHGQSRAGGDYLVEEFMATVMNVEFLQWQRREISLDTALETIQRKARHYFRAAMPMI